MAPSTIPFQCSLLSGGGEFFHLHVIFGGGEFFYLHVIFPVCSVLGCRLCQVYWFNIAIHNVKSMSFEISKLVMLSISSVD
jgi:hypothetical protein